MKFVLLSTLRLGFGLAACVASRAACVDSMDPWTVVQAQDAGYNAHDPEAFADCYSDNAVIEGLPTTGRSITGNAAIREKYKFLRTVPTTFHTRFVNKMIVGAFVIVQEEAMGGPSDWPKPTWAKESIAIYEVRGSKVVHVWFPTKN